MLYKALNDLALVYLSDLYMRNSDIDSRILRYQENMEKSAFLFLRYKSTACQLIQHLPCGSLYRKQTYFLQPIRIVEVARLAVQSFDDSNSSLFVRKLRNALCVRGLPFNLFAS